MIRRACLDRVGLFDESMVTCEDLDLYRRLAEHYRFEKIDLPLVKFRIHSESTQRKHAAMAKGWEMTIDKIAGYTPLEFQYYKNEAIAKNLVQIARLYIAGGRPDRFFIFCARAAFSRPNWILTHGFWRDVAKLSVARLSSCEHAP
jgi:hypothetical protein